MFLASQLEELMDEAKDDLSVFSVAETPEAQADALEVVATRCTQLGLAALLVDADQERFRRQLTYAAYARRWFIKHAAPGLRDHPALARSRWPSFYAALVVGDMALALQIADAEPLARIVTGEYGEEFGIALAIAESLTSTSRASTRDMIRDHAPDIAAALDAIEDQDAAGARKAILGFLETEAAARRAAPPTNDEIEDDLGRRISLIGLALIRVARVRGVAFPAIDHPRAPRAATQLPPGPTPDDVIVEVRA